VADYKRGHLYSRSEPSLQSVLFLERANEQQQLAMTVAAFLSGRLTIKDFRTMLIYFDVIEKEES
jgi:hypothetical protein